MADARAKSFGVVLLRIPAVPPTRNPAPPVPVYQHMQNDSRFTCYDLTCIRSKDVLGTTGCLSQPPPKCSGLTNATANNVWGGLMAPSTSREWLTRECTNLEGRLNDSKERVFGGLPRPITARWSRHFRSCCSSDLTISHPRRRPQRQKCQSARRAAPVRSAGIPVQYARKIMASKRM